MFLQFLYCQKEMHDWGAGRRTKNELKLQQVVNLANTIRSLLDLLWFNGKSRERETERVRERDTQTGEEVTRTRTKARKG